MIVTKKLLPFFACIMITAQLYGQAKIITVSPDDAEWHQYSIELAKKLKINDLQAKSNNTHWRFWYTRYIASAFAIDLEYRDSLNCKAYITQYTFGGASQKDDKALQRVYVKHIKLSSKNAFELYKLAHNLHISGYRWRDTVINEHGKKVIMMHQILDAAPYLIEFADAANYTFKSAVRPDDTKQVRAFLNTVDHLVNFNKLNDEFKNEVPLKMFSSDRWQYLSKPVTDEQLKQYEKYWKRHSS